MSKVIGNLERLEAKVREIPLLERLKMAENIIGKMCSEQRPPRMSVPVQPDDEDFFILTTLTDATDQIEKQKQRIAELVAGILPVNLDVSRVMLYWKQRAEEAESKLQEKQVEQSHQQTQ